MILIRPPLCATFSCKRALYMRFYRRLFVALRSLADGLSVRKSAQRVRSAEELEGVIEKVKTPKEHKSKAGGLLAAMGGNSKSPVAMMSVVSMSQRRQSDVNNKSINSATNVLQGRRRASTGAVAPTKAQARWKLIQKEVCDVMSWRDLLSKRSSSSKGRICRRAQKCGDENRSRRLEWIVARNRR